jgi:DNA topoisomerase-1
VNLVVVESPSKAKTINKYLGDEYTVLASFGHIRDLPPKDGSVDPESEFAMKWELADRGLKTMSDIAKAAKTAKTIWLATDPDREGEAISWHVLEVLKDKNLTQGKTIRRVTFNEITKNAVQKAFKDNARDLDQPLIDAYMARRALDYLVGFNLSPVLWRKLPGSRSAGRVQSVALRLICEREFEIEAFHAQEYWSIETLLHTQAGLPFTARLTHLAGNKLGKLDIGTEAEAKAAVARIQNKDLKITAIEEKQSRRQPAAPFITSTLQQEASRKMGFGAQRTMRTAQKLYEGITLKGETVGLITYMRTDGTTLSQDAVDQCRSLIKANYGDKYLPDAPRLYKSKAKNAQEAHEAIRPTDLSRTPESLRAYLNDDEMRLYDLIWKRTMASQMENAILNQMAVDISDGTQDVVLRANGSVIAFDGFLTLYIEGNDDDLDDGTPSKENEDRNKRLPPMKEGEKAKTVDITPNQHFTQPPPRYTEATLVKTLEEHGIGRPSTYASIIQVLQDRSYVKIDKKRFVPEDRGRIVTAFLKEFFTRYVDYDFTADLENQLDSISAGTLPWKDALKHFWQPFTAKVAEAKELRITDVIDHLNETLKKTFFPNREDGGDPRQCQACGDGVLSLKLGKFGAFIGCSNYPDCRYTRPLSLGEEGAEADSAMASLANEPIELGLHPELQRKITVRKGPYGAYVQMDPPPVVVDTTPPAPEYTKSGKLKKPKVPKAPSPKRQGLPAGVAIADVTLEMAVNLLSLPREVGVHPEDGEIIEAGIGRFGAYLKYKDKFTSLPKDESPMEVGLNRAVVILAEAAIKRAAKEAAQLAKGESAKDAPVKAVKKPIKKPAAKKKAPVKKETPDPKTKNVVKRRTKK